MARAVTEMQSYRRSVSGILPTAKRLFLVACLLFSIQARPSEELSVITNLPEKCSQAVTAQRVCLVYISRVGCPYCGKLEKEVLFPLLKVDEYVSRVQLYELPWELTELTDFKKQLISAEEFIDIYGVVGTPTLLFLDASGNEVSERMVGYQSEDFYWHYLDKSIDRGLIKLLDHGVSLPE